MTDFAKNFGQRLKELRTMRGLTQARLAELVGIETMTVSRIETGVCFPKKENIETFAKILDVEIKDFFEYRHLETKEQLIADINKMLESASLSDVQFIKKVFCAYLESLG